MVPLAAWASRMGSSVLVFVIGLVFVVGGLAGKLTLLGTNSGLGLAAVGAVFGAVGAWRIAGEIRARAGRRPPRR